MTKSVAEESSYFECDYERNCTPLYKALEKAIVSEDEDYDNIASFLDCNVWKDDTLIGAPNEVQAKTWVTRFKHSNGKKTVEWSQLPLHLAIVGKAPSNIIGSLVKLYPQALRCTDDQQMLPLHLALRHSADDEIVAYLLMQFPDAVNAKGKNGRSAIDCALRARDKLRGIIVETFVEKTKAKINAIHDHEKTNLVNTIDEMNTQLLEAMKDSESNKELKIENSRTVQQLTKASQELANLQAVTSENDTLKEELDLLKKKHAQLVEQSEETEAEHKLALEKVTSEQLTERVVLQKKFDWLVSEQKAAVKSEKRVKDENEVLRKRMEELHKRVEEAKNQAELQKEMISLQEEHLKQDKSSAKENIDSLKGELKDTLDKVAENQLQEEVKSLQKMVKELEKNETKAKTTEEVDALRSEVDILRAELRDTAASSAMKMELLEIRKFFEQQMRSPTLSSTQMKTVANVVDNTRRGALEAMTCAQLAALKAEAEGVCEDLKKQELLFKARLEAKKLEERYIEVAKHADNVTKKELVTMKTAIEGLKSYLTASKSQSDIFSVLRDIESMKSMLSAKEIRSAINKECHKLEDWANQIMIKSDGCRCEELVQMKTVISSFAIECKSINDPNELSGMKTKLSSFQAGLQEIEEATKISNDIRAFKVSVSNELETSSRTIQIDVTEMRQRLDAIAMANTERKKLEAKFKAVLVKNFPSEKLEHILKKIDRLDLTEVASTDIAKWANARKRVVELKTEFTKVEATVSNIEEVRAELDAIEHKDDEIVATTQTKVAAVEPKKKNKLTKFFKRFARPPALKTMDESDDEPEETKVATVVPPSMSNDVGDVSGNDSIVDSVTDSTSKYVPEKFPPAVRKVWTEENQLQPAQSQEMELTLALHKSMSMTATDDDEANKRQVAFSPTSNGKGGAKFVPSALRKVRSLDPRMMTSKNKNVMFDPVDVVRSWSRTIINNDNEVELEAVSEVDSRA